MHLGSIVSTIRLQGHYLSNDKPDRKEWLDEMGFVRHDLERRWGVAQTALTVYKEKHGDLLAQATGPGGCCAIGSGICGRSWAAQLALGYAGGPGPRNWLWDMREVLGHITSALRTSGTAKAGHKRPAEPREQFLVKGSKGRAARA
jgi:hypothetical protein